MMAIIGGHVEAVRKLVANDQVHLEDLDYRDRINFDNGNIVHGFLTILGIIDEAKQERFRMSINILRLGEASDTEDGERTEAAPEADEIQTQLRSIVNRMDELKETLEAKLGEYDDIISHVNSLDRKHERETSGFESGHMREIREMREKFQRELQAKEASHSRQQRALQRRQTEEKAKAEAEKLKKKKELEVVKKEYLHLLEPKSKEPEAAAPETPCPTCPVCFERLVPPIRIFQCIHGHVICERCRSQPQIEVSGQNDNDWSCIYILFPCLGLSNMQKIHYRPSDGFGATSPSSL